MCKTNLEVIDEIRSQCKPYLGVMKQARYSMTIKRIKAGEIKKEKTVERFIKNFRYEGKYNSWNRIQEGLPAKKLIELQPIKPKFRW